MNVRSLRRTSMKKSFASRPDGIGVQVNNGGRHSSDAANTVRHTH